MRLIDADVLINKYARECSVDLFRYEVLETLSKAPTVDAIPISWIKAWWYTYRFADVEIGDMLEGWEAQKNETRI